MLVGYARVSTLDQKPALQTDALTSAGCERIFTETASGAQRDRPELKAALAYLRSGDTLVVWKLDRLARSMRQLIDTVEDLLAEYHIRYGGYGGIGYYHVSDTYIALFSHFILCGVWEAVYILDGLLKNDSAIQPDTVHADTQGQSAPVFALAYLLGITLMPRIRD